MTEQRADLKRGYYLLNTDGGNSGDPLGRAAIGALLRTRRLVTVAQISKAIGPATHNVAEYRALIEGLKLARDYGIERVRVFMDSELVVLEDLPSWLGLAAGSRRPVSPARVRIGVPREIATGRRCPHGSDPAV
jgi:ribonuclease H / adenosylcobalamin/alpha-ribazole phosphatase